MWLVDCLYKTPGAVPARVDMGDRIPLGNLGRVRVGLVAELVILLVRTGYICCVSVVVCWHFQGLAEFYNDAIVVVRSTVS